MRGTSLSALVCFRSAGVYCANFKIQRAWSGVSIDGASYPTSTGDCRGCIGMAKLVVETAFIRCSMGTAPSSLGVLPLHRVQAGNQWAANVQDHKPMVNVRPFGMCTSVANPSVAAATAAAMGVLTPMPCAPGTMTPWVPGAPTVLIDHQPALNDTSRCICIYGGIVDVAFAGQSTVEVP
jgi:hypothetical protein